MPDGLMFFTATTENLSAEGPNRRHTAKSILF